MRRIGYWVGLSLLAAGAAWAGGNVPGAGELAVYGYVVSVDARGGTFTMDVAQWRTARDTGCFNPLQQRVVGVNAQTQLAPLGASEHGRPPVRADLRPGRKVYAVGPDPGSGGVLQARWVALEVSAAPPSPGAPVAPAGPGPQYAVAWLVGGTGVLVVALLGGAWWAWRRRRGGPPN